MNIQQSTSKKDSKNNTTGASLSASKSKSATIKTQALREELLCLTESKDTGETEKIFALLHNLATTREGRQKELAKLLPKKKFEQVMIRLEVEHEEAVDRLNGYRRYMKGVHQRINRYAGIIGGEGSWGFVHGADHEDLRDRQNENRDIGRRKSVLVSKEKVLLALYRTAKYGTPYSGGKSDEYAKSISEKGHAAWQG